MFKITIGQKYSIQSTCTAHDFVSQIQKLYIKFYAKYSVHIEYNYVANFTTEWKNRRLTEKSHPFAICQIPPVSEQSFGIQ